MSAGAVPGPRRDALRLWGPAVAWMALLFALSSHALPEPVSHFPDWLSHPGAWAVLAVLVSRALAGGLDRPVTLWVAALAVLISTLYGVTDELHQSFVPGRDANALDVLKDLIGSLAGAGACAWPRPTNEQRRKAA